LFEHCVTVDEAMKVHRFFSNKSYNLIVKKGADYSGERKDTFFNMRLSTELGITDSVSQGVLVRLADKFARLINLSKKKGIGEVKDESIDDTGEDIINYTIYTLIFIHEERGDLKEWLASMG
jgi:hypothetical protein